LRVVSKDLDKFVKNDIRLRFLGRRDGISSKLLSAIDKAEEKTRGFTKGTLAVCFNYGGQQEIVDAAKKCVEDGLMASKIDLEAVTSRLYAPDIPAIDLVVRTSGEQRLSNFMLWRCAYSELYFIKKYWPDMTKQDVADIISEYGRRSRRFGG
jgi:undecaprenyl diphosphate synthase